MRVFTPVAPVRSVTSVQYRVHPANAWTTVDLTYVDVLDKHFVVRDLSMFGWSGNLATRIEPFVYRSAATMSALSQVPVSLQYVYIAGYPQSALSADAALGATTLTLTDATGVVSGMRLSVTDAAGYELVTVTAAPTGTSVPVTALSRAYATGSTVDAIPAAMKRATMLIAKSFIAERGSAAVSMDGSPSTISGNPNDRTDMDMATALLHEYKRVVLT